MASRAAVAIAPSLQQPKAAPAKVDSAVFYGFISLLLLGPLAFGGGEPWSRFVLEAGSAALLLVWVMHHTINGHLGVVNNPLFRPMLLFGALVGFQLFAGATAYRGRTLSTALLYVAYAALCFLAVQCLQRSNHVKILATTLSMFGAAVALLAIAQSLTTDKLYWVWKPELGGHIFGPYVNHNHYAGLMEMMVPVPLVFSLTSYARRQQKILAIMAAALMACTIFLSGSRGGMIAFAAEIGILVVLTTRRRGRGFTIPVIAVLLVTVLCLAAWLGGVEVFNRVASIASETRGELSGGTRLAIDRDSLRMFARRPIAGWGVGVFPDVYPRYRSFYTTFFVNHAHNDYLQLLVETGALGFGLMTWWLVIMYRHALKKIRCWKSDINGAVALASLVGCTGILVHSFVDSNLQIPGNAALFYVLCVIAAMEPRFGETGRVIRRHRDVLIADGMLHGRSVSDIT